MTAQHRSLWNESDWWLEPCAEVHYELELPISNSTLTNGLAEDRIEYRKQREHQQEVTVKECLSDPELSGHVRSTAFSAEFKSKRELLCLHPQQERETGNRETPHKIEIGGKINETISGKSNRPISVSFGNLEDCDQLEIAQHMIDTLALAIRQTPEDRVPKCVRKTRKLLKNVHRKKLTKPVFKKIWKTARMAVSKFYNMDLKKKKSKQSKKRKQSTEPSDDKQQKKRKRFTQPSEELLSPAATCHKHLDPKGVTKTLKVERKDPALEVQHPNKPPLNGAHMALRNRRKQELAPLNVCNLTIEAVESPDRVTRVDEREISPGFSEMPSFKEDLMDKVDNLQPHIPPPLFPPAEKCGRCPILRKNRIPKSPRKRGISESRDRVTLIDGQTISPRLSDYGSDLTRKVNSLQSHISPPLCPPADKHKGKRGRCQFLRKRRVSKSPKKESIGFLFRNLSVGKILESLEKQLQFCLENVEKVDAPIILECLSDLDCVFDSLEECSDDASQLRQLIRDQGGVRVISSLLQECASGGNDVELLHMIQIFGCMIMQDLAYDAGSECIIVLDGGLEAALRAIRAFPENFSVNFRAYHLMVNLLVDETSANESMEFFWQLKECHSYLDTLCASLDHWSAVAAAASVDTNEGVLVLDPICSVWNKLILHSRSEDRRQLLLEKGGLTLLTRAEHVSFCLCVADPTQNASVKVQDMLQETREAIGLLVTSAGWNHHKDSRETKV